MGIFLQDFLQKNQIDAKTTAEGKASTRAEIKGDKPVPYFSRDSGKKENFVCAYIKHEMKEEKKEMSFSQWMVEKKLSS